LRNAFADCDSWDPERNTFVSAANYRVFKSDDYDRELGLVQQRDIAYG
jgi:hypothetical protein